MLFDCHTQFTVRLKTLFSNNSRSKTYGQYPRSHILLLFSYLFYIFSSSQCSWQRKSENKKLKWTKKHKKGTKRRFGDMNTWWDTAHSYVCQCSCVDVCLHSLKSKPERVHVLKKIHWCTLFSFFLSFLHICDCRTVTASKGSGSFGYLFTFFPHMSTVSAPGPDGIGDYRPRSNYFPRYIGVGASSAEATGDLRYLCRGATHAPPPMPRQGYVGEVGWGLQYNQLLNSGTLLSNMQIKVRLNPPYVSYANRRRSITSVSVPQG